MYVYFKIYRTTELELDAILPAVSAVITGVDGRRYHRIQIHEFTLQLAMLHKHTGPLGMTKGIEGHFNIKQNYEVDAEDQVV